MEAPHLFAGIAGAAAAAVQIAVGELAAVLLRCTSSPIRATGRWFIDVLPGPLVDATIALLEGRDKLVLLATLGAGALGAAAMANAVAGATVAASVLGAFGIIGLAASFRRPELARGRAIAVATAAGLAGPGAVLLLPPVASLGLAAACLGASALFRRRTDAPRLELPRPTVALPPLAVGELAVPGLSPLFTPAGRFYVTDVTFPPPRVDVATWRLDVSGLVDHRVRLSFEELLAMDAVELDATLVCVHNPVGGHRIGTARWQGVPLAAILRRAGMAEGADHILARSVDGFSGGHPRSLVDRALVVYGMNGEPLPLAHGGPVRLIVPGVYGYDANVKWLERLEVTRFETARDYWERKGWPRVVAAVRTQSRIDVPRHGSVAHAGRQVVAGVAWSPPRGVTKVELRIDDGPWRSCELGAELAPTAWRQWRSEWEAASGHHTLQVRAWSPDGVQDDGEAAPFPRGAAGHHRVVITINDTGRPTVGQGVRAVAEDIGRRVRLARAGLRAWKG